MRQKPDCTRRDHAGHQGGGLRRSAYRLSFALAAGGAALGAARDAQAATCVQIDEGRDGLTPEERQSARTLLEDALAEQKVEVAREGCTETWTLYHVRLGETLTVVVQGPAGARRERVKSLDDLPALYRQLSRSLVTGGSTTNDSASMDRRDVTESQEDTRRVRADAIWYAKLGYGATTADDFHSGPAFGFGRRWELDRMGIDFGFLNFILYQGSDDFSGASVGWIDLGADFFFDPYANSTAFVGAGLSLGNHSISTETGDYEATGLQGKATLGYEMFRASTIRLLVQLEAAFPMYRLTRESVEPLTGVETRDRTYCPTLTLSLGLGWGGRTH
jgi:hypothetical protein